MRQTVPWKQALRQPAPWYATADARQIAENILVHERDSGGWSKSADPTLPLTAADGPRLAQERAWENGTIDNGATWREIRFLARVHSAQPDRRYLAALLRGLDWLRAMQYPNGGFPQYWPHPQGYQRRITFNDDAMGNVLRLLRDGARGEDEFAWINRTRRRACAEAVARGIGCILRCQVSVRGQKTVWCAQHDETTFAPAAARRYELPSLSGGESVGIARFLMEETAPSPGVRAAIEAAIAWFQASALTGLRVVQKPQPGAPKGYDVAVVGDPGAPPLWARFYEIETNRPFFCGRDGKKKYALQEIEIERRTGYRWYVTEPAALLEKDYPAWRRNQGPGARSVACRLLSQNEEGLS